MSWRRKLSKLGALFRQPKPLEDLEKEIRVHLQMEERENLESGTSPEEARYAALRRFGTVALAQERSREMRVSNGAETLCQDIRYGLRQLRRSPSFTAVAVRAKVRSIGYGLPSDFELNFGRYLPALGRADEDDTDTQPD
jgi:hypothetical protein